MKISIIQPRELGPSEITAWHAMQRATSSLANPFLSPEFAIAAGAARPDSRVAMLIDGHAIIGYFPFEKRRFSVGVPLCGWLSACQGVIHAPGAQWDARWLLRDCGLAVWKFDNLLPGQESFAQYRACVSPLPVIDLGGGFDKYYKDIRTRSRHLGRELERKTRKLSRDAGDLRVDTDARNIDVLRMLMAWKSEQYQRTNNVDRFRGPWIRGLLERLLATRTSYLAGQLSVLYAGENPVAIQFGLRAEDIVVGWFTGYSPDFARYSPGLIHLMYMAQDLAKSGVCSIHMGTGAGKYAEPLKSYDILMGRGAVTSRSVIGLAHHALDLGGRRALSVVRSHPSLHNAADWVLCRSGVASRTYGRL
ncbi:MAG TPA: GNAT family N-acetyltransferase [Streptosporangiaceae bacterium]